MTKNEFINLQKIEVRNRIQKYCGDENLSKFYKNVLIGLEIKESRMTIEDAGEEIF